MRLKLIMWEKSNGYTGKFVADKLGILESTWSKIKTGKQNPTFEQMEKMQTEFNIKDVLDLFEEDMQ